MRKLLINLITRPCRTKRVWAFQMVFRTPSASASRLKLPCMKLLLRGWKTFFTEGNLIKSGNTYLEFLVLCLTEAFIRLQIVIAKIQQSLPEMKRDGNNVLGSLWSEILFNEDSTTRSGSVLPQVEFIPKLAKQLQDNPFQVIKDFEEIRKFS